MGAASTQSPPRTDKAEQKGRAFINHNRLTFTVTSKAEAGCTVRGGQRKNQETGNGELAELLDATV